MRFLHLVLALALVCAAQLHLPALKVLAWGGMLVSYSREAPLREAVEMTFDGEHPCALCCAIQQQVAQQPESELRAPPTPETRGFVFHVCSFRVAPRVDHLRAIAPAAVPPSRTDEPELPPPRLGACPFIIAIA